MVDTQEVGSATAREGRGRSRGQHRGPCLGQPRVGGDVLGSEGLGAGAQLGPWGMGRDWDARRERPSRIGDTEPRRAAGASRP